MDRQTDGWTDGQMDKRTDGHDEANSRFSQFCENDYKFYSVSKKCTRTYVSLRISEQTAIIYVYSIH